MNTATHTQPHTLLVVEDHSMVRESLVEHLRQRFSGCTVLEADTLEAGCREARQHAPDLIVLDLNLLDATGLSALPAMRSASPDSRIVVLSGMVGANLASHLRELGADAFVPKSGRRDELVQTLQHLLATPLPVAAPASRKLTPQQLVVLELTLVGKSNKEIAQATGLSSGTVRNYLSEVFLAFDVHSRSQLLALFRR
jgi:DNA-binding NarL/FixJ family response regulator